MSNNQNPKGNVNPNANPQKQGQQQGQQQGQKQGQQQGQNPQKQGQAGNVEPDIKKTGWCADHKGPKGKCSCA
jgi:hypothetical protein